MNVRNLIADIRETSVNKLIAIGVLIAAAAGLGYFYVSTQEKENLQYPSRIIVETRPGAAVLIPFSRRLASDGPNIANAVHGDVRTDPQALAGGISVLRSEVYFRAGAAVGEFLFWTPPETSGQTHFSLAASADVELASGGSASLRSESARVTLQVTGAPVSQARPPLAGNWSDGEQQWKFAADGANRLTIINDDGRSAMDYNLYPDQNGRWFLAEIDAVQPRLYWIEVDGDTLRAAMPGPEFAPITELQRG